MYRLHQLYAAILVTSLFSATTCKAETWKEFCSIPNLIPLLGMSTTEIALSKVGLAVLSTPNGQKISLLKMPQCTTDNLRASSSAISPSGYSVGKHEELAQGGRWVYKEQSWFVDEVMTGRRIDQRPPNNFPELDPAMLHPICRPEPVLSSDGSAMGWVARDLSSKDVFISGHGTSIVPEVVIQSIEGKQFSALKMPDETLMDKFDCSGFRVLDLDMKARTVLVSSETIDRSGVGRRNSPVLFRVNIDTNQFKKVEELAGLYGPFEFRRLDSGWVAWGSPTAFSGFAQKIVWSLSTGVGSVDVRNTGIVTKAFGTPSIHAVAVTPNGEWLAVSFDVSFTRGVGRGKTLVINTGDKRIALELSHSASITFIGNNFFAYGKFNSEATRHETHVLEISR